MLTFVVQVISCGYYLKSDFVMVHVLARAEKINFILKRKIAGELLPGILVRRSSKPSMNVRKLSAIAPHGCLGF